MSKNLTSMRNNLRHVMMFLQPPDGHNSWVQVVATIAFFGAVAEELSTIAQAQDDLEALMQYVVMYLDTECGN